MTPAEKKAYNRAYHQKQQKNPAFRAAKSANAQRHRFLKLYGITLEQRDELFARQGGACAVCFAEISLAAEPRISRAQVDHDHTTGRVRGLLCSRCNNAEGLLRSNPALIRRLAEYVESARKGGAL